MATKNIGNLQVSIGADTAGLSRGIGRAKALMGGLSKAAKVSAVAAGAAFAAASVGLIAMTREGLSAVDSQAKLAATVDGSIDGLRALQMATGDAGVAVEDISKAVQIMGKRLAEAARDGFGPAAEALEMLDLRASDLMKMDVDARFGAIADRVQALGMNAQEAGDLMRQFGVRSNEVGLLLLQGSGAIKAARAEVEKFGISVSRDMAAKVEAANDALSRVGFLFEGMRNQLAVGLSPVLHELALNLQEASLAGGPLQLAVTSLVEAFTEMATAILNPAFLSAATMFGVTIANGVAGLSRALVVLADNTEIAGIAMVGLGAAMAWFSGPVGLAIAAIAGGVFLLSTRMGEGKTAAELAEKAYSDLHAELEKVDRSNSDAVASGEDLINTHIDQARAAIEAARAEYALARAEASRRLSASKSMADAQPGMWPGTAQVSDAEADLAGTDDFFADKIAEAEAQLELYQKTLEGFSRSSFPTRGGVSGGDGGSVNPIGAGKMTDQLKKLINSIDPAKARIEQITAAKKLLKEALADGAISLEEYNLRLAQVDEKFKEIPPKAGAASKAIAKLSDEQKRAKAAAEAMDRGWDTAFSNLVNNIEQGKEALKAFVVEALKMSAIRGISNLLGGASWFSDPLIGKNALGTDNWRGGLSWVGERGPELVNLPMGSQVIPNSKLGSGGGGSHFTYAPVIDAKGASLAAVQELDQRMRSDAAQFNSKVQQAVLKGKTGRKL